LPGIARVQNVLLHTPAVKLASIRSPRVTHAAMIAGVGPG
jgi:hypothetical protein